MSLEKYRTPSSALVGEWLELPDAPGERFLVKLPSAANREWQREVLRLMAAAGVKVNAAGAVDQSAVSPSEIVGWMEKRLQLFASVCVVEGPSGFDMELLATEYWPALVKLFEVAEARAQAEAEELENAVGEQSA